MSLFTDKRAFIGMDEVRTCKGRLAVALLGEFLGTAYIVLIGCGAVRSAVTSVLHIALAFGLTVGIGVLCFGSVSGGHLNPAVTCGFLVAGRFSLIKTVLYIVFQCVGAVIGAALLRALSPEDEKSNLGLTVVSDGITPAQGFGIETLITFLLVLTVFAATDENRLDIIPGFVGIAVGLVITGCHLFAVAYTGSSMNTARSFGPAMILQSWDNHWVYWVGPIFGGILAGALYQYVLKTPPPDPEIVDKVKLQFHLRLRDKEVITDKTTCF